MTGGPGTGPADPVAPGGPLPDDHELPRLALSRRTVLAFGLFALSALAFLYFVVPKIAGLKQTWARVGTASPGWIALAVACELASYGGYMWLFRTVFVRDNARIDWRVSYQITMAGVAATRLFAAAGAGGVALTAWALRRSGMPRRVVAARMVAFMGLLYLVYVLAVLLFGLGLRSGALPGSAPFGFTVVPAIAAAVLFSVVSLVALLPADVGRGLEKAAAAGGRMARVVSRLATIPGSAATGLRTAAQIVREREPGLLGAVMWWGFDIATLWASFHAFGGAPTVPVVVMGYFVGMLANLLPLPGGVGGVDGGMIGGFIAFGVPSGLAVIAVLVYRAFSFWLPTLPGAIAYVQLRRTVAGWRAGALPSGPAETLGTDPLLYKVK